MKIFACTIFFIFLQFNLLFSEDLSCEQQSFLQRQNYETEECDLKSLLLQSLPTQIQQNSRKQTLTEGLRMMPIKEPLQKHFIIPLFFQMHEPPKKNTANITEIYERTPREKKPQKKKDLRVSPTKEFNVVTDKN